MPTCLPSRKRERHTAQGGYALLFVVFLAAMMILAVSVAAPVLLTEGRREMEDEMIWRGEQYARGVTLYFRKYGRLPQSAEELVKPKDRIRFMRKPYADPMNREDGSWRFIYVGSGGQLIGSLTRTGLIQFPTLQQTAGGQPPRPTGEMPGPPAQGGAPRPAGQPPPATAPTPGLTEGAVLGGNIIGVGSKVNRPSIKAYRGYDNYRQWEFIWDPTLGAAVVGTPGGPGQPPPPQPRPPQ